MRLGASHVKGLYDPVGDGEQFANGCQAIWDLDLRDLYLWLTPVWYGDYPYQTDWSSTPNNLTELLQTTQFATQLAKAWECVHFAAFTFANGATNWCRVNPSKDKFQAEYDELYAATAYLLTTYSGTGKRFIFKPWEGDWAVMDQQSPNVFVPRHMLDYYGHFYAARQQAVSDARRNTPHSNVSVRNAIEVNRVLDSVNGHRPRILTWLPKVVTPDIISWSSWDGSIDGPAGWGTNTDNWRFHYLDRMRRGARLIKEWGLPWYVSEVGFPENEATNEHPTHDVAAMIQDIHDIAEEEGAEAFLYWQVYDNEPHVTYGQRGLWLVKPNGTISIAGLKMQELAGA